ncbi:DUF2235 domain-containing protein [Fluviispira vulneris]|uniref:DUF2235 domain-containing protein n=1 Tax=Fluviispira vulneris TaxID=2763012 RepID=UPI001644715F|nr:DUF2235 domain-containing protein [Fluviispira vulneris]
MDIINHFYFFDGTGNNISSSQEQLIGKSVVAELYDLNNSYALSTSLDEKSFLKNLNGQKNIKIYFPGPGAGPGYHKGKFYDTPGRENFLDPFIKNKSSSCTTLNQVSGSGWEYNEAKALYFAANSSNLANDRHFIIGYSRGAITAISFSKKLSELRPSNEIYLFIIDPVAGFKKSKLENTDDLYYSFTKNKGIIPYVIGKGVKHVKVFYATTEQRTSFKPQLPALSNERYRDYSRPLYFLENTSADIYFMYADHRQIAYRKYDNTYMYHGAGQRVFYEIAWYINFVMNNENINDNSRDVYQYHDYFINWHKYDKRYKDRDLKYKMQGMRLKDRVIASELDPNAIGEARYLKIENYAKGELYNLRKFDYDKLKQMDYKQDVYLVD